MPVERRRGERGPGSAGPAAALVAAVLAVFALGGCRDAPELFEPPQLEPLGPAPYRLTFAPGREVSPSWSPSGEEVVYIAEGIRVQGSIVVLSDPPFDSLIVSDTLPTEGIVHSIPRTGGVASRLLPNLQSGSVSVIARYATQASDGRVALVSFLPLGDASLCGGLSACDVSVPAAIPPRLSAATIRVRDPGGASAPESDPFLEVAFPGRAFDTSQNPGGLSGLWLIDKHPFQQRFTETGRAPERVSWAPQANLVVYSDGVALRVWNLGTGGVRTISGTSDGVEPAWSPTGDWIAFERAVRGGLTEETCEHRVIPEEPGQELGSVICVERRRTWSVASRSLAIIRPDGTDLRVLPEGSRPAWGADGQRIYYEFGGMIWSVGIDGAGAAPVPGTANGVEPAVSPDGRWLAFTRLDPGSSFASDIWIVELGE